MNEADVNIKARRITDTILEAHRANVAPLRELISGKIEALLLEASRALSSPDTKEGQGECIRCEITAGEYPDRISVKPPAGTFERGFVKMGASVDLIFQPAAPAPEPEGEANISPCHNNDHHFIERWQPKMVCKICGLIAYDDDQTPPMSLTPGRLSLPSPKEVPMAMLEEAGKEWLRGKPGYIGRLRKIVAKYMPGYTVKGE